MTAQGKAAGRAAQHTQRAVFQALDNAARNGYDFIAALDDTIAGDLATYDAGLEGAETGALIPHIKAWKAARRSTHTPGPWKVSPPLGPGDFAVLSDKVNAYGNFYVAVIPNGAHAEAEANARLIAAAPRMLDELTKAADILRAACACNDDRDCGFCDTRRRLRAILRDVQGGDNA